LAQAPDWALFLHLRLLRSREAGLYAEVCARLDPDARARIVAFFDGAAAQYPDIAEAVARVKAGRAR
jgi:hypothetical protein